MYKTVERVRKIVVLKLLLWKPSHKRKEKYIFQGIRRALTYVHNSCEDILLCIRMLDFFNKERHRKPIFRRRTLLVGKYYHCVCVCVCVCMCRKLNLRVLKHQIDVCLTVGLGWRMSSPTSGKAQSQRMLGLGPSSGSP